MAKREYDLLPRGENWEIRAPGAARAVGVFGSFRDAMRRAQGLVDSAKTIVRVHDAQGRFSSVKSS